ncbi:ATP-dependent DNA helicase [Aliiroseovarius sp. 2305UL8-7]|uniref:ATP-dependent DNA helicase n=1 Tax=Aliiroseovarius conchicola TaxID=3121637 RepID=UPI003528F81A
MQQNLSRGHTLAEPDDILENTRKRLGLVEDLPASIMDDAVKLGIAVRLGPFVQPAGAAWMEAETTLKLRKMAGSEPCSNLEFVAPDLSSIVAVVEEYLSELRFGLTRMQIEAVYAAHKHRFMCLGGYAGSGKTTVLEAVCATMETLGRNPIIITLSGRAAQRATEATGRKAITIARFLMDGMPLGARDLLVIDEASMVALPDIWRILQKIGDSSLIMCGDPAQLPPISFGLVFSVLIDLDDIPSVLLDRVMRQDETTGIPAIAEGIRHGTISMLPAYKGVQAGVSFIQSDPSDVIAILENIRTDADVAGLGRGDLQIIGAVKAGAAGVNTINRHFHEGALSHGCKAWPHHRHVCVGEPFIFKKNDTNRGLTNGSMGYFEGVEGNSILVEVDGRADKLRISDWSNVDLAHAITVHKSQGSQWDVVVIPIFDSFVLDRSLVYTALTRSRTQTIFVGKWSALQTAVEAESKARDRKIGFPLWLNLAGKSDFFELLR